MAILGGNDVYWQARLEPDRDGNPCRVLDNFGHHNPGLHADERVIKLMQNVLKIFGALPAMS